MNESFAPGSESPGVMNDSPVEDHHTTKVSKAEEKRISKLLAHLKDYYCNVEECDTEIPYPMSSYMSLESLSTEYKNYICAVAIHSEPPSFSQAKRFDEWLKAINKEIIALESTDTWTICSLPPGKHAIGCKWVHKLKFNADGTLERYKARLVAKGYTQELCINLL